MKLLRQNMKDAAKLEAGKKVCKIVVRREQNMARKAINKLKMYQKLQSIRFNLSEKA